MTGLIDDMRKFYSSRDVMGFAVSMTVGLATRDVILVVVNDLVVPILKHVAKTFCLHDVHCFVANAARIAKFSPVFQSISNVSYAILIWFLLLFLSYILLECVILGWVLKSSHRDEATTTTRV